MQIGNYAPDLPDRDNEVTVAKNLLPSTKSYKSVGGLTAISNALTSRCIGAIAVKDATGNAYNYAATASDLYLLASNAFTSKNYSVTGTTISFAATTNINSSSASLLGFSSGQVVTVTGTANNNTDFTVTGTSTASNIPVFGGVVTEAAGNSVTVKRKYSTASDEVFEFAKFGTKLLATNYSDPVQSITIGSGTFSNLAGSPPRARHVAVVGQFVVLGNINDGTAYPSRIHWSAIGSEQGWTPTLDQSDTQDLYNGGHVQKIIGGDVGIIFCEKSIYRMRYEGLPTVFYVEELEPDRGTPCPNSVVQLGSSAFYLGLDGFYLFNGQNSQNIGVGRVDKTFYTDFDQSYFSRLIGAIDPINTIVFWAYPGSGNVSGLCNKIIAYNYTADRWAGPIEAESEWIFSGLSSGVTLEGLAALYGSLDAIPISLDARFWQGGSTVLSAFDSSHRLALFTGSAMAATIETGEISLNPGGRSFVTGIRPQYDGAATATAQIGSRNRENESVAWSPTSTQNTQSNLCHFRSNARYQRLRINLTGNFSHLYGFDVEFKPVGKK